MDIDFMWKEIMVHYIEDDLTMIALKTRETDGLIILAVAYLERGCRTLDIYTGNSYYEVFWNSGYCDGLLSQDDDYITETFSDDECELIFKEKHRQIGVLASEYLINRREL